MFVLIEHPAVADMVHATLARQFPGELLDYLLVNLVGRSTLADSFAQCFRTDHRRWMGQYALADNECWRLKHHASIGERFINQQAYVSLPDGQAFVAVVSAEATVVASTARMMEQLRALGKVGNWHGIRTFVSLAPEELAFDLACHLPESSVRAYCEAAQPKSLISA
jgi:hypothetical protein